LINSYLNVLSSIFAARQRAAIPIAILEIAEFFPLTEAGRRRLTALSTLYPANFDYRLG